MVATLDNIEELLKDDTKVKIAVLDMDGVLRGKMINKTRFLQTLTNGFGFCSVLFGWDIQDRMYFEKTEFNDEEGGFGDMICKVDLKSYRRIPWEHNTPFFLVDVYHPRTKEPIFCSPRGLVRDAEKGFQQELGCTPFIGIELEFFCFKETPETLATKGFVNRTPLTLGNFGFSFLRPTQNQEFYYHAYDWLREFNIELEAWHTEMGPGIYEAAVAYRNASEAGDRAALLKTSMKQIALQHGLMATFMAKPDQGHMGCSGHMHISLKDEQGRNLFTPRDASDASDIHPEMSKTMVHFLAGVLRALPSILAVLAPTVNSYKRLVENQWAPVTVSWGIENRMGAIRVIVPPSALPNATRLEVRVPGSDVNPPLAMAAILKAGHWGIKTKQTVPVPPLDHGKEKASSGGARLARNLQEAVIAMGEQDSIARKVLGDAFVDHYIVSRKHEWNLYQSAVTDYELKRYFELI
ncbi:glutamine synthetase [Lichtheimia corymbifera JMRC:FSU:9682]|uniref:Glutamine synthetase n=1 Tax=Lichtheimia corymbifera JMRC:FSU:9682 TaxID=1263082 RepID=A0A068SA28_9FUNG|nr:glutamine synthetase [Lichtheimia corymbifera JMRC:FSU:9682]